jgi:hypothetical protein
MAQQTNPSPPDGSDKKAGLVFAWLIVAFVPSAISIALLGVKNVPQWSVTALLFIGAGCCLCSAFGMLSSVKDSVARAILGLLLAGGLFVLNVLVVVFVGCSNMGRIAP